MGQYNKRGNNKPNRNSGNGSNNRNDRNYDKPRNGRGATPNTKNGCSIITGDKTNFRPQDLDHNDPNWMKDPKGLVENAARISSYYPAGTVLYPLAGGGKMTFTYGLPTVLTCNWYPVPGRAKDTNDPMCIAANRIYQQIRKALNKPIQNYQFADPVIAYICYATILVQMEQLRREYAAAQTYMGENLGLPEQLLTSWGYNRNSFKWLRDHLALARDQFKELAYAVETIFEPIQTTILDKWLWMAKGVWEDHNSQKTQYYSYFCAGYYKFSDISDQGSEAVFVEWSPSTLYQQSNLWEYKITTLLDAVRALRESDSYNYMMSDMQRAFPEAGRYVIELLQDKELLEVGHNEVMLNQFQNIVTAFPVNPDESGRFNIHQDVMTNTIIVDPQQYHSTAVDVTSPMPQYYNMWENDIEDRGFYFNAMSMDVSVDEAIENMNGKVFWRIKAETGEVDVDSYSCWIPVSFGMVMPRRKVTIGSDKRTYTLGMYQEPKLFTFTSYNACAENESNAVTYKMLPIWVGTFDWHPMIWTQVGQIGDYGLTFQPIVEDINLIRVPLETQVMMNSAEMYAMWKVDSQLESVDR